MSSPNQREWEFEYMHFGVPPPPPEMRLAFVPVGDGQVIELAQRFRGRLAEPLPALPPRAVEKLRPADVVEAPLLTARVDVGGYPPLHVVIRRFGQTAAVATWIHDMTVAVASGRHGGQVQAVSLYLTGIDRAADDCAVSVCRQMRLGGGGAPMPLPVEPAVYDRIRKDPSRPLGVQIFCQALSRLDQSIRCGFLALGAAFFGTLGVEKGPASQ
jgi:hypothetical protein